MCTKLYRFQTLRLSALADKIAVLSELNDTVLGSARCPGMTSCDESVSSGLRSPRSSVHVSILLFFRSATICPQRNDNAFISTANQ